MGWFRDNWWILVLGLMVAVMVAFLVEVGEGSTGAGADKCKVAKDKVFEAVAGYYQFQEDVVESAQEAIALGYDKVKVMRMQADWIEKAKVVEGSLTEAYEEAVEECR